MRRKSKYWIVFPRNMIYDMEWPKNWCVAAGYVSDLLRFQLNIETGIGSEIKAILSTRHRWDIIETYKVTPEQLDDYLKADCSTLFFYNKRVMAKAIKELKRLKASGFICLDNYRNVLVQQAQYHNHNFFLID